MGAGAGQGQGACSSVGIPVADSNQDEVAASMRLGRLRRRLGRRWRLLRGLELEGAVLVYQMGKVASTSVFHSLLDLPDCQAYHVHRMAPDNIARLRQAYLDRGMPPLDDRLGKQLYQRLVLPGRPASVISLVREPISRNISAFFQGLDGYAGLRDAHRHLDTEALIDCFLSRYLHAIPLEWFDREMKASLAIDVFDSPFPRALGRLQLASGPYRLLLMRHDLDDGAKEQAVAEFLGRDDFRLRRVNEASAKGYAEAYRAFRDQIRVPVEYADAMLGSRYAQHFYGADELEAIRRRWVV